ncbi:hypothetical protein [Nonomuraea sp. NPDC049784]|uniref:hypothetical protein n=1 Tax=Nonomuraea sp. NPDC049784 TaxID=3154361 RepID=UPI0033D20330
MPIDNPQVGEFARYHPNGSPDMPVLVEIVHIGLGQAYRGGERMLTGAVVERSANRCFLVGQEIHALERSEDISPAPKRTAKRLHLEPVTLWAACRDGQLWDWYGISDGLAWVPKTLEETLMFYSGPFEPRLFRDRDLAEKYLAESPDAQPGDSLEQVQAKVWRSEYRPQRGGYVIYERARLVSPGLPRPDRKA